MHKKQIVIWTLAGFLITYHTVKIYSGLVDGDDAAAALLNWSSDYTIRLWIIFSLLLVIMFKRMGLVSMWLSITALIITQFMNLPDSNDFMAYIKPLKGFVIPMIISWMFIGGKSSKHAKESIKKPEQ